MTPDDQPPCSVCGEPACNVIAACEECDTSEEWFCDECLAEIRAALEVGTLELRSVD